MPLPAEKSGLKPSHKTLALWLILVLMVLSVYRLINQQPQTIKKLTYTQFHAETERGSIERLHIKGRDIQGTLKDGTTFHTIGVGALIAEATGTGDFPLLLAATLALILTVVTINRFFWQRLYRLAEARYRME